MECRILDYNLAFQNNVTLTASSSDTNFPVSNLANYTRSKVWRSTGNFVISATNNKIDFKKASGGAQLTATVASGTYTPTTLATAIVAALAAQDGASTYTCTFSATTGKWTIATSGAFLSLLFASGTNSAADTGAAIGFTADQTGSTSYTGSQIAIHTEEWVMLDTVTGAYVDTFVQFFDPLVGIPFSSSAVLTVQASATNSWSSPAISQVVTIDTAFEAASFFWSVASLYRYWRLKIVDPQNANLYCEVSKLALGQATQLTRVPKDAFTFSLNDQTQISRTNYGHQYADLYPHQKSLALDYAGLTYADIKAMDAIYRRVGKTTPVVIALDDTETYYDKEHFLIYACFGGPYSPKNQLQNFFSQQITFSEVF